MRVFPIHCGSALLPRPQVNGIETVGTISDLALGLKDGSTGILNVNARAPESLDNTVKGRPRISLVRLVPERLLLYDTSSLIAVIVKDAWLV